VVVEKQGGGWSYRYQRIKKVTHKYLEAKSSGKYQMGMLSCNYRVDFAAFAPPPTPPIHVQRWRRIMATVIF